MVRLPDFDEQVTVVTYGPAELAIAADAVTVPLEILPGIQCDTAMQEDRDWGKVLDVLPE